MWFTVGAPLLPKLRGHFAEFLNHNSLDRLSILYLITCVGLGYGQLEPHADAFLGSIGSSDPHQKAGPIGSQRRYQNQDHGFAYGPSYILRPGQPSPGPTTFLRHPCEYAYLPRSGPTLPHNPDPEGHWKMVWAVSIPCSVWAVLHLYGNINPLSIDYACRPRLRSRLTQGRLA